MKKISVFTVLWFFILIVDIINLFYHQELSDWTLLLIPVFFLLDNLSEDFNWYE